MAMDVFSLFAANAVILSVMAIAFLAAWMGQRDKSYWKSWLVANAVLAAALLIFMFEHHFPDALVVILPNVLLVVGFGLRWQAAREFAGRPAPLLPVWGPALLFLALCSLPPVFGSYSLVYTSVNILLAAQATAIAYEFWRDRRRDLLSGHGLIAAYGVMALSFAARVGQGMLDGSDFARSLPHDDMLVIHLVVALFHTTASGAFALSIAYERGAAELREAAMRDALTGLYNRRAFEIRVGDHLKKGGGEAFAIVIFDVDNFKHVNDRHGHAAGDAALRKCAELCVQSLRQSDFLARIGGEEFAAILPDVSADSAFEITDRVRRLVGTTEIRWDGVRFTLSLSAGICHSSAGSGDFDQLMKKADRMLYQAKHGGRNRVKQVAA